MCVAGTASLVMSVLTVDSRGCGRAAWWGLGGQHVVVFHRIGKKILLTEPNYAFRASSASPTNAGP